jgi:hypothetical protein
MANVDTRIRVLEGQRRSTGLFARLTEQELEAEICAISERLARPYAGPNLTLEELHREIRQLGAEIKADCLSARGTE